MTKFKPQASALAIRFFYTARKANHNCVAKWNESILPENHYVVKVILLF